jgi:hypothetical protein
MQIAMYLHIIACNSCGMLVKILSWILELMDAFHLPDLDDLLCDDTRDAFMIDDLEFVLDSDDFPPAAEAFGLGTFDTCFVSESERETSIEKLGESIKSESEIMNDLVLNLSPYRLNLEFIHDHPSLANTTPKPLINTFTFYINHTCIGNCDLIVSDQCLVSWMNATDSITAYPINTSTILAFDTILSVQQKDIGVLIVQVKLSDVLSLQFGCPSII